VSKFFNAYLQFVIIIKGIVLGGGLVGSPMAYDLAKDTDIKVTVADRDQAILDKIVSQGMDISVIQKDLSVPQDVTELVSSFDMVINAVPGFMGFETAKAIIRAKTGSDGKG